MSMNEGFFGQYSVFCVFGSVVGCVVVPLIAQVLQQQSMECVILSAIVISLTAAHLNKKGANDPPYSKILVPKEFEKKKINHINNNNSMRKHRNQTHHQQLHNTHHIQAEQDYMQQHEHLKTVEMERRSEEKRLKKLRKREERLKKREEESRKQKELEEHYRNIKEKRLKQQKENYCKNNMKYLNSAVENLEKFCARSNNKRCGLSPLNSNEAPKHRTLSNSYYQQKIPRFERHRVGAQLNEPVKNSSDDSTGSNNLIIKCDLSASCSSLSSISSSDSASPPIPVSPASKKAPWVITTKNMDSLSAVVASTPNQNNDGAIVNRSCGDRSVKSYSHNRLANRPKLIPDSSSLFCTQLDGLNGKDKGSESPPIVGEYSLFGPQRFATAFTRSPVM